MIAAIGISGFFIFSHGAHTGRHLPGFLGDADAIGSEEDARARFDYELMLLRDPATGMVPAHMREK